jgi:regulator of protease activity HflC (stomatin/prohibitin superfamily)
MSDEMTAETLPIDYSQLSQVQVPLAEAGAAFSHKDANGRTPVVLVPLNPHRIKNSLVLAGIVILVAGFIAGSLLDQWVWPSLGAVAGIVLIVLGVWSSFIVRVPEGTVALLTRAGRYVRTLEAGSQMAPPWYAVSHLVTRREIPYDVPAVEALTQDNVRARVDTLITFTITDPYRFVYSITADDFDAVLLAACLDVIRGEVRRLSAEQIANLTRQETAELREALNVEIESYGVTIKKINVTDARPPDEFLRSQESRQLAVFHSAEQAEKQALAQRLQANVEALARQQTVAQVEREREQLQLQVQEAEMRKRIAELEAETEELRLSKMEERLTKYPQAAVFLTQRDQLKIAKALAGNTRAVLQIGAADDILRAFVIRDFLGQAPAIAPSMLDVREEAVKGAAAPPAKA